MKSKNVLITLTTLLLFFLGCSCLIYFSHQKSNNRENPCYFAKIPVRFFPFTNIPLIKVEIEEKNYTVMIDTGSGHSLDLHKRSLEEFHQELEFLYDSKYSDLKGNSYQIPMFRAPPVRLHKNLEISGLDVGEENLDFLTKGAKLEPPRTILQKTKEKLKLYLIDGRLGWPCFKEVFVLFDFHNNALFLSKDLETSEKEGIFIQSDYIKIPLQTAGYGPIISFTTNLGTKRFLLDSGTTHSIYIDPDRDPKQNDPIRLSLSFESFDFDDRELFVFPLSSKLLKDFDAILGIDFFKTTKICIDYKNNAIYLEKPGFSKL